ncbi:MAG: lysostaphin resistance A-like protein [Thiothrix sp.]
MSVPYLALASVGKNHWWRYLLGVVLILVFWQVIGALPLLALMGWVTTDADPLTDVNITTLQFSGIHPLWGYLGLNFTLLAMLLGVLLVVRFIHQRPLHTLLTASQQFNWQRLWFAAGWFFILVAAATLVDVLLHPELFRVTFFWKAFFTFLPIALIITPLQAAAEEVLFRGYMMQGLGLLGWHPAVPVVGSALWFAVAHLANPEVDKNTYLIPLLYFFLGLFLAVITVKSGGLELAIGVHAANNLFTVLVMNYQGSALPSPSLFTASELNPLTGLLSLIVIATIFYWIAFVWRKGATQ